jgi:hypothetical protein
MARRITLRSLTLTLFVFVFLLPLQAQRIETGIKAGASMPFLSGSDWSEALSDVGGGNSFAIRLLGGAYLAYRFSPQYAVQLEALYTTAGGDYAYTTQIASYNYNYAGSVRVPSLEIPLLFRATYPVGPGGFYGTVGPSLTVLLGNLRYEESSGDLKLSAERSPDNRVLFSAALGGGYLFELDRWLIDLGIRYSRSFTPFYSDPAEDATYLNAIGLYLGGGTRL